MEPIRQRMAELGVNQSDLARAAGMTRTTVSRAVRGHVKISPNMLVTIEEVLGLTAEDLGIVPAESRKGRRMTRRTRARRIAMLLDLSSLDIADRLGLSKASIDNVLSSGMKPTERIASGMEEMTGHTREDLWPQFFGTADSDVAGGA